MVLIRVVTRVVGTGYVGDTLCLDPDESACVKFRLAHGDRRVEKN